MDDAQRTDGTSAAVVRTWGPRVEFQCPGCEERHAITTAENGWTWNGDITRPTFTPSVLAHPHPTVINPDLEGDALWAAENVRMTPRCHSFVTGGRIAFLSDSTHALAGQTVDLPAWPSDEEERHG